MQCRLHYTISFKNQRNRYDKCPGKKGCMDYSGWMVRQTIIQSYVY